MIDQKELANSPFGHGESTRVLDNTHTGSFLRFSTTYIKYIHTYIKYFIRHSQKAQGAYRSGKIINIHNKI